MEKLLNRLGWSQAYFAKLCGVTPKTVGEWLKSEPELPMRYLRLCARLLNV